MPSVYVAALLTWTCSCSFLILPECFFFIHKLTIQRGYCFLGSHPRNALCRVVTGFATTVTDKLRSLECFRRRRFYLPLKGLDHRVIIDTELIIDPSLVQVLEVSVNLKEFRASLLSVELHYVVVEILREAEAMEEHPHYVFEDTRCAQVDNSIVDRQMVQSRVAKE